MNIYLYGIGPRTKKYIAEHQDISIVGILDGYRNFGEFCGIPVLALEEISTENSKIIIIARPASARIIYARIKEFCAKRGIGIYDVDGRKMETEEYNQRAEAEKIDMEKLYTEIDKHDVVSFDIFDTLLVRKCGSAEKLFAYVAVKNGMPQKYVEERIKVEKILSLVMTPDIDSIYQTLADNMQFSREKVQQILSEEIEAEKKFLVLRRELAEAFHYAVFKGKRVILISDMYLNCKVIEEILSEKGIDGYTKMFVSSEYGTDKAGSLFDIAVDKTVGKNMLHIGDDKYRDYECAKKHGIDVFLIQPGTESVGWNLSSPETIGSSLLGPALFSFALWLDHRLREDGVNRIYFSARDGYLIKQIFDLVEQDAEAHGRKKPIVSEYLLTSRSLAVAAALRGEEDIRKVMELSFDGRPDEMLRTRFYLKSRDILPYENHVSAEAYILQHRNSILDRSRHLRENYWKYLERTGIRKTEKAAFFDFVSTGTCQMCLERITGSRLYGYYFETVDDGMLCKNDLYKNGFIQDIGGGKYSCDNYFYIETLIKETVPTLQEIDNTGKAVYRKKSMKKFQKEIIRTVQAEAVNYARDRLELVSDRKFQPEEAREHVYRLRWITTKFLGAEMDFVNYDAFTNREIRE